MRILVAFDSFKETCSARDACEHLALGLRQHGLAQHVDVCPLADGGEGILDAMVSSATARLELVRVTGPLGEAHDAPIAWLESNRGLAALHGARAASIAIIEAASCLGLALVPWQRRDPLRTTSYGLGQLIGHALRQGAQLTIIGLGGTATVDAGLGMAQALGVNFGAVTSPAVGGSLEQVSAIDLSGLIDAPDGARVVLAADVRNPLLGARGAARAFAPQKGASLQVVELLERSMQSFARKLFDACRMAQPIRESTQRCSFDAACSAPSAGAAGGIGFALQQLYGASVVSGIELVMDCVGFEERLRQADWVVTGEGRLDAGSFEGKVVSGILDRARARKIPVVVVCGTSAINATEAAQRGICHVETLLKHARDIEDAKARVCDLLERVGSTLAPPAMSVLEIQRGGEERPSTNFTSGEDVCRHKPK